MTSIVAGDARPRLLRRALRLESLTFGWNVIEGAIAIAAAVAAGSVVLFGFGVDSFVESAAAGVMLWRLLAERRAKDHESIQRIEKRAERLVAVSLFLLALYVTIDAAHALWTGERPRASLVGIVLLVVSAALMMWLARAKRRTAAGLRSRALAADAFQTTACWWLSIIALAGMLLNGLLGWWWADPVAALGLAALVVREAREAWKGEGDCCSCS